MRTLVVGAGAREHAVCWSLSRSRTVSALFGAPGNAGIAQHASLIPVEAADLEAILRVVDEQRIELVVVGPEQPLVAGLVDQLAERGVPAFGPSSAAARLEGSKAFTKDFCRRYGIPTAGSRTFTKDERAAALAYLRERGVPLVVKADGLAAGKGVVVAESLEEAAAAVTAAFDGSFGEAGARVIVEDYLVGEEASLFALCDGTTALPLGTAQDHKRAFEGERGPNTGGMGAISPTPNLDETMIARVMREIVEPTVRGMAAEGAPYRGILYAGLMITGEGPQLIEYNVRLGDPEAQVVLPRLATDLGELILSTLHGTLHETELRWRDEPTLGVVMATRGYPGAYGKGSEIKGLGELGDRDGLFVFHAGTAREAERLIATGGRVLTIVARGATLTDARDRAYEAVARIDWPQGFFRRDIGWRALRGSSSATDSLVID